MRILSTKARPLWTVRVVLGGAAPVESQTELYSTPSNVVDPELDLPEDTSLAPKALLFGFRCVGDNRDIPASTCVSGHYGGGARQHDHVVVIDRHASLAFGALLLPYHQERRHQK